MSALLMLNVPDVVKLPAEVPEEGYFSADPETIFDLTETRWIAPVAISGLIRAANAAPTLLWLDEGGPVHRYLTRLFQDRLTYTGSYREWLLDFRKTA